MTPVIWAASVKRPILLVAAPAALGLTLAGGLLAGVAWGEARATRFARVTGTEDDE